MKRLLVVAIVCLPTLALAQSAPEITLKVTPEELNVISEGLQFAPFGKVAPLIQKLRQQVVDQQPKPNNTGGGGGGPAVPPVETPK